MPSFQDSAVIFFIALLLFGPKKLPELARYVGKLMNEFRRASSEFRLQMEDEFRQAEQTEQQKKIAAMEAAAPLAPAITADIPEPEHPHTPVITEESLAQPSFSHTPDVPSTLPVEAATEPVAVPLPIASNGDLHLMPPSTGLPVPRPSSMAGAFDSIPLASTHAPDAAAPHEHETSAHG